MLSINYSTGEFINLLYKVRSRHTLKGLQRILTESLKYSVIMLSDKSLCHPVQPALSFFLWPRFTAWKPALIAATDLLAPHALHSSMYKRVAASFSSLVW